MDADKGRILRVGHCFVVTTVLALSSRSASADGVFIENSPSHAVPTTIENNVSTTVTNTVPVNSINEPARSPVKLVFSNNSGQTCPLGIAYECFAGPYTVPAGKRLVIQQVSGSVVASAAPSNVMFDVIGNGSSQDLQGGVVEYFPAIEVAYYQSNPFLSYFDGGTTVSFATYFTLPAGSITGGSGFTITGYMIDCSTVACNPIVTQ